MTKTLTGHSPEIKEIIDAFGVPIEGMSSFSFSCQASGIAVLELEYNVKDDAAKRLIPVIKKYKLVDMDSDKTP